MVDFLNILYLMGILGLTILINTILGVFISSTKKEFNIKKLFLGILKSLVIGICLFLFIISLEIMPPLLSKIGVQIPDGIPDALEIIIICLTVYKKYAIDCFSKFKIILNGGDEK